MGRDNVYLNGSILGMRRAEINARFDEMVQFAGVGEFLDMPVKRYSSGMYVRLAFSVAAHLEPEVLFVDEVLSVGDQAFQEKCLGRLKDVTSSGRTVLFVSHNLPSLTSLCKLILFERGRLVQDGPIDDVVRTYLSRRRPILRARLRACRATAPGRSVSRTFRSPVRTAARTSTHSGRS